jgi:hypothetical protein
MRIYGHWRFTLKTFNGQNHRHGDNGNTCMEMHSGDNSLEYTCMEMHSGDNSLEC